MKKGILSLGLILVLLFSLTACSKGEAEITPAPTDAVQEAEPEEDQDISGTITITGSTSVDKILNDMMDEFIASNPDVDIKYTGTGSSAGIEDTLNGINTLGTSSREIKQEEKDAGVIPETFAYDGIAVIVNPANGAEDLTVDDLAKIYSGEINNWSQLGGKDGEIVVVSREGASGTRSAFEELIGLEAAGGLTEATKVVEGNGNVQTTVGGNESAIGYVSFSFLDETVKALTIGGVIANAENTKTGSYPLSRPFLFVYTDKTMTPAAQAFIDFTLSADGQSFVEKHGGIRVDQ